MFKPDRPSGEKDGKAGGWDDAARDRCLVENALMPVMPVKDDIAESAGQFMNVALVLFEPRFDPDKEKWYVDIELDNHSVFSEPFIRFGLVRYSGKSRADMRVSQPDVAWATVMPERTAKTSFDAATGDIGVTVEGRGAKVAIAPMAEGTGADFPQIFATVMRERDSENGTVHRTPVALRQKTGEEASGTSQKAAQKRRRAREERDATWLMLDASRAGQTEGACWKGKFSIDAREARKPGRLILYVEEVEHYRPASYPQQEPVDHAIFEGITKTSKKNEKIPDYERDVVVESGPRFACRIALDDDGPAPAAPSGGQAG